MCVLLCTGFTWGVEWVGGAHTERDKIYNHEEFVFLLSRFSSGMRANLLMICLVAGWDEAPNTEQALPVPMSLSLPLRVRAAAA